MTLRPVSLIAGLLAVGGAFGTAAISRAPLSAYPDNSPVLRLAWSVRPERIERCRTLSDAELADVPAHMRQRVQCEGRAANYRLAVTVDGTTKVDTIVTGGGARSDRPVYVFRELTLPAGPHQLQVRFEREELADSAAAAGDPDETGEATADTLMRGRAGREAEERSRRQGEAVPPEMELASEVRPERREVLLVTYDIDRRALVLRTGGGAR